MMKIKKYILPLFVCSLLVVSCSELETSNPVIPGTKMMELSVVGSDFTTSKWPDDVSYAVLWAVHSTDSVQFDGFKIHDDTIIEAGIYPFAATGGPISDLTDYDSVTNRLTTTPAASGTYKAFLLGYDKNNRLVGSSNVSAAFSLP